MPAYFENCVKKKKVTAKFIRSGSPARSPLSLAVFSFTLPGTAFSSQFDHPAPISHTWTLFLPRDDVSVCGIRAAVVSCLVVLRVRVHRACVWHARACAPSLCVPREMRKTPPNRMSTTPQQTDQLFYLCFFVYFEVVLLFFVLLSQRDGLATAG